jgi:hypothetical protein
MSPRYPATRPARSPESEFTVSDWKPFQRNTLLGFLNLTTPSGLIFRGCSIHEKEGSRWISMPAQKLAKDDGTTTYKPMVEFVSKEARDRFNEVALRAVDRFLASQEGTEQGL